MIYDYKREVLGDQYSPQHPVRNWLLYKLTGQDCDAIALSDELDRVQAGGFLASADSMNSFWTTYKAAVKIWHGDTFTLNHPTNNIPRLIERYDSGEYSEVNVLFADLAALSHARGNFILVPVYRDPRTGRPSSATNFNLVRNRTKADYWDLTLVGIKGGEFDAFFGGNPVAPQFDILSMPGRFAEYVERNRLDAYVDGEGEVRPLWRGHFAEGARSLPRTQDDIVQFVENASAAIRHRDAAIGTAALIPV